VTGLSWSGPGDDDEVLRGSPYVFDPLGALSASVLPGLEQTPVRRHVRAFFQGNRFLVRDLASAVCQRAGSRGRVLDLYAGVGLYGLALTAAGRRGVTSIEGDRRSGSDLAANVEGLGLPLRVRASSVERYLTSTTRSVDLTVILNPPRTGLSKPARTGLVRLRPARIVYVSCDVPTLARDVRVLLDAGWDLSHLQAFDLFPNTPHVETLAVLDRRSG
jgi:tRNA/tmRNA/rRNA uracil-C5-methylase (TrmA/RlmC/RlmD family)